MNFSMLARSGAAAVALSSALLAPVQAAPVLSINVSPSPIVGFNSAVTAEVVVSGLTQAIGGFAFNLNYDVTRMSFGGVTLDPTGSMGAFPFDISSPAAPGSVSAILLADVPPGFTEPDAAALQGTGFTLGTFTFSSLTSEGIANFSLSGFSLSNFDGTADIDGVTATGASVCVSRDGQTPCDNQIPEPMTAWLVGIALGGLALTGRRQRKAA